MLSEYYDKIGGHGNVGKKRKQGRLSNIIDTSSNLLPKTKKQKLDSETAIDTAKIISVDGKNSGTGAAKIDIANTGAGKNIKPDPKTPSPKKRRGRSAKTKALEAAIEDNASSKLITGSLETGLEDNTHFTNVPGTVRHRKAYFKMGLGTKHFPRYSDNHNPSKRSADQVKAGVSLPADEKGSDKDIQKKVAGRLVKGAGQKSSTTKMNPLAEEDGKTGLASSIKTKESAAGQLNHGLAGSIVQKGANRPGKSGGGVKPTDGSENL